MDNIKVITLCGSIKFMKEFRQTEAMLTRMGFAVITPFFFEQGEEVEVTKEEALLLGKIHYKKIAIADEIFVIDVDGYIGESTKKEIEYAKLNNKNISYYSNRSTL
ncbi:hypothetical protein A5821_001655 [Enterococcus sp. 7F3_DIV0205]|uniref:Nucleoside 2-deoxyribosyltransferase n=1 Tax=Candidatus Enterococcus palustris TaxID=1834189 RepID=A0AAQ3W8I6_9ENTE|nr:hypothetical protein [Enterococcus sp. 7F3_DIV0205]OTN86050.1 hypothetical protein A5821_002000 [Enterococcus sp. 7F3_DIV0205]